MAKKKRLPTREYVRAVAGVARLSFKTAPGAVSFKVFGIIVDSTLPIAVTYFAALTTTQLALAFTGNETAGQQAVTYIIITAILGLGATVWRSIDQYVQAFMRFKIEARVSDTMYEHFLSLDFWQYDDKETADLYDRAQKFSQFFAYVFDRLAGVLSQFISLVFALVALMIFLPWMALFVLLAVLPGVYLQFKLSRAQIQHWDKTVGIRRSRSFIEWNLLQPNSIAELRLNGLVRHLLNLRQSLRDKDEKERLVYERKYIGKRLLADGLEAVTELGVLLWIALQIIAREQPIGQFVYVQQLVSRAFSSANGFVYQLSTIDEDLANLFDYQKFMSLQAKSKDGLTLQKAPDKIIFREVSFRYPKTTKNVLENISFQIHKGQHIAIVGENGAGKSTLIKLLTGLYAPTKGSVSLDEVQLKDIAISSWHKELSVLQQDFEKYLFTDIQNNVYFGDVSHPLSKERLASSLRKAEALDFTNKLPQGLKTYPNSWMEDEEGHKGIQLSGGQWQRLALARNFYRDASIIVLDEPTSAIDALAEARIFKRLFAKANEKTVITISHRLSTVEKADRIIVLEDGRIAESGTHDELVANRGQYYRMFESQIELK
ncbi:MAG TPA: ABC transporter ATP-binding protein [Candidatus Saccharimonadales bacterium]|nr:ABC transporter ATP-binding protein [Candidatus Saccharimonadales bacterium]